MIIVSLILATIAGRDRNVNYCLFSSNQRLITSLSSQIVCVFGYNLPKLICENRSAIAFT